MKRLIAPTLLACLFVGPAAANSSLTPSEDPTDIATLKQIALDMGDAMVAADIVKLNQIFADDWVAIAMSGKTVTKDMALNNVKSGKDKLESFELGPIDVQVFGNVAVSHGGVTEKRSWDGKDSSGTFVWMDILEKRGGKWIVVRSAGDRVK